MNAKTPSESRTELTDIVLPPQTNQHGTIFGGEVMSYIDRVGSVTATRHAGHPVVTASFDSMDFLSPIHVGEAICLRGVVTWTGHTSMEVQVVVEGENIQTGERRVTGVCFLTFVAVDENGRPVPVPPLKPETEEEKFQYELAKNRQEARKQRRKGWRT